MAQELFYSLFIGTTEVNWTGGDMQLTEMTSGERPNVPHYQVRVLHKKLEHHKKAMA